MISRVEAYIGSAYVPAMRMVDRAVSLVVLCIGFCLCNYCRYCLERYWVYLGQSVLDRPVTPELYLNMMTLFSSSTMDTNKIE